MTLNKIKLLEEQHRAATIRLQDALEEMWPIGLPVRVMLSAVQKVPSVGTVCYYYEGSVGVRLEKLNRRGNGTMKRVSWSRVCL